MQFGDACLAADETSLTLEGAALADLPRLTQALWMQSVKLAGPAPAGMRQV